MNPPETSQSKKFRQRRKKRSSFQSMTFLWLFSFTHIFYYLLFSAENSPKKEASRVRNELTIRVTELDFKIAFQGHCLIGLDCNLEPQKRLDLSPPPKMHSGEATLLNRAQILTRGIFGCYCQSLFVSMMLIGTVFENHRKSLIQHCERSELLLHFEWTKVD